MADRLLGRRQETPAHQNTRASSSIWNCERRLGRFCGLCRLRLRGGLEVDFIVRLGEVLWAIEAKSTNHPSERDAAALVAAKSYLPKGTKRVIVVPNSPPRKFESGVEVLGLADLLAAMTT
jgi:hypothetical protein